ncbi:DNA adenine methylase [Aestuariivirga sp. YIM B02566]|uniref:DNA adenine methylase n=1 Tax=Taklimakanibacter albus TaxID=2800327 RepID=A0ACC5R6W2_9HYPH|nr:DNA adenine methylase [Aestuariivirga sp. YIM B02566]MBK1868236.1 DNA adenine methylase [Aestuariivirga sp. YIM B02566]
MSRGVPKLAHGLQPVRPASPAAPWIGGKRLLAPQIVALIERIPHSTYAEPFVGMGGVFLRRTARPRAEVINDVNQELITLFRVLQRHYVAFIEMIRWQLSSRAEFERLAGLPPANLTDLERGARFLYLQRLTFGGKVASRVFGVDVKTPARFDVSRVIPLLEELHDRLAGVGIECLPYAEFIRRYDREGVLFYLDPPYWGSEDDYGRKIFGRGDFQALADILAGLKGMFLLSVNDRPELREIFAAFEIKGVRTTYTVAKGPGQVAREILVSNIPGLFRAGRPRP